MAACDETYYWKFGAAFLDSIRSTGGFDHVHLHLYWPSDRVIADLDVRARDMALTWTVDRNDVPSDAASSIIYMAATRFVVAHFIVERGCSVFITDIDSIANRPIWPAVEDASSGGVGLYFRPEMRKPWRKVLASGVIIHPTIRGRHFAHVMARSTLMALADAPAYHVDQTLLYYASRRCAAQYFQVPRILSDYEFRPDSVIWTAKGPTRKQSAAFRIAQDRARASRQAA
ncbi:hypothetical protein G5B40_16370 [Pikeienuella piscinae]|uniref:Nucleotide-diphospho-sugar transferase domain-containing protein n=1 Tax=Pikeienuella piscinae TaxID=2748098 RepID=A0A7L5BYQ1_9RHOB|nr:hypothetical protein [Pikeienuella piscinae]QIE56872.1 hypothetical protein G5B40_16370 [Pikeienuella piscinae]